MSLIYDYVFFFFFFAVESSNSNVSSICLEKSKQATSLKTKEKTCATSSNKESESTPRSDKDLSFSFDTPQLQFNLCLPEGLLHTTASQVTNSESSNAQTHEDQLETPAPKFFYEENSLSQRLPSVKPQPAKSKRTARKQTARNSTQPQELKRTFRPLSHRKKLSRVNKTDDKDVPPKPLPLRPKQTARKHTQRRTVPSLDKTCKKPLNLSPVKRKRRNSSSLSPSLLDSPTKNDHMKRVKFDDIPIASEIYVHSQNSLPEDNCIDFVNVEGSLCSTQIVDVGGPEEVLWSTEIVKQQNFSSHNDGLSTGTCTTRRSSARRVSGKKNTVAISNQDEDEKNEQEKISPSNLQTVLKDVVKMSKRRKKTQSNDSNNSNNTFYMSPEVSFSIPFKLL